MGEARIGQTGRTCRRWFAKGVRPRGRRDLRHRAVYLFGAVCPERDQGGAPASSAAQALILPEVGTAAMQAMPKGCPPAAKGRPGGSSLKRSTQAPVRWSSWTAPAGTSPTSWPFPANLTPVFLPPYSPELNAIERLWLYLRKRYLSHRLWPTYDAILDACGLAWNKLCA